MKDRDAVKMALYDAIDWQTSLADAYTKDSEEAKDALNMASIYRKLLKKRYFVEKTPMEKLGENSRAVSIYDIKEGIWGSDKK